MARRLGYELEQTSWNMTADLSKLGDDGDEARLSEAGITVSKAGADLPGIGRVLLRRCLADQRAGGHATAQIGWAGPIAFYSKAVGARLERIFWTYRKAL